MSPFAFHFTSKRRKWKHRRTRNSSHLIPRTAGVLSSLRRKKKLFTEMISSKECRPTNSLLDNESRESLLLLTNQTLLLTWAWRQSKDWLILSACRLTETWSSIGVFADVNHPMHICFLISFLSDQDLCAHESLRRSPTKNQSNDVARESCT